MLLQQILSRTEDMESRLTNIDDRLNVFEEKQNVNDSRLSIIEGEDELDNNVDNSTIQEEKGTNSNPPETI